MSGGTLSLAGKVAIVTGGGTGIGLGIARVLAAKGAKLVLAQPDLETAERAAAQFNTAEVLAATVDISDPDLVDRLMEKTVQRFGQIDILVNNAGITGPAAIAPFVSCDSTTVSRIVDVNLKGTFYCSQFAAQRMIAHGTGGSIVHIASVGAYAAQEFASLYCATKAAQVMLAKAMALELAPHRIRVNCVAPGDILTEANATITTDKSKLGAHAQFQRTTPIGRRGAPQDIGHAVAYLASDDASFVTGTTLVVDGGFLTY